MESHKSLARGVVDDATLELLVAWRREDAADDPEAILTAEQELAELKKNMNEHRAAGSSGRDVRAVHVLIGANTFTVELEDGRAISVPFAWSPRLASATEQEREELKMIGGGDGIHWPLINEHLSDGWVC